MQRGLSTRHEAPQTHCRPAQDAGPLARLELLGRSQNWLAREVGISRGYLSTLVNEGRAPSGRLRRRMQRVLGVEDFHELFELQHPDDAP